MGIITLSESDCEDCHRCVRNCSLKAIGIKNGEAEVVEEKCIYCGQCINVCPQNAKEVSNQLYSLNNKLDNKKLVASIAPSFVAAFDCKPRQLVAGLKKLGFWAVEETALGAEKVAEHYKKRLKQDQEPLISACCPAVVNLVEKHYPELIPYLSNSVSPMVAHGKMIKQKYDDVEVVFIGPCIAKLDEVTWDVANGSVDLAITFNQLHELLTKNNINLAELADVGADDGLASWAASFPIESGILKASDIDPTFNSEVVTVSGLDKCKNTFDDILAGEIKPKFVEAMICSGGCINGPALSSDSGIHARREKVINYTNILKSKAEDNYKQNKNLIINLERSYQNKKVIEDQPSEDQIQSILSQLGKFTPEDELDCGGCGYDTCREKAIAVYQGYAENKMCIPYMKGKLESLADIIVKSSPNAIIVVNKEMVIQKFNPKANELFNFRKEYPIGKQLERYIDPKDFIEVWEKKRCISQKRVDYDQYNVVVEKSIFPLSEYELVVGILTDVTARERQKEKVAKMKKETLEKADKVINKQMKVAQEIASLLGESTSETKVILHEVSELMKEEGL